ncbi:steryl-sulfatase-like [Saccoglossus kowalevskii]|uniref:Steryl-sulfatase-like n=1 Tax=Saccoglossus kowalevskii TaxID=10224 RepID=A0ABM0GRL0_SACKO|nr:PREDICTED: steryl-sulfatase-like [Saccoglossus kowalevskii]
MIVSGLLVLILSVLVSADDVTHKPNFVIIMVDDLGIGDVGCFGNDTIRTPNIDRLAAEGVKLNHNMVPAPTCTPSRAAFLTGRYPIRMGLASRLAGTMFGYNSAIGGMPSSEITFAELLKEAGYTTAVLGKWHLGLHSFSFGRNFEFHPLNQGFDFFYGTPLTHMNECADIPNGRISLIKIWDNFYLHMTTLNVTLYTIIGLLRYFGKIGPGVFKLMLIFATIIAYLTYNIPHFSRRYVCVFLKNYETVEQPFRLQNMTLRLTKYATSFIEENKEGPFLLYLSFLKVHTALFTSKNFTGVSKHGQYGDNVEEMDWSVGRVLAKLDQLQLTKNTFVYFMSDHGGHVEEISIEPGREGEREGGWNGIYKGGKAQVWEGGVRVPTIARYPPLIPQGSEISVPTSSMDVTPTLASLAGVKIPRDVTIDGVDITKLLAGKDKAPPHEFLFIYCGAWIHGVTHRPKTGNVSYKVVFTSPKLTPGTEGCFNTWLCRCHGEHVDHHDPPLVYDLTHDPSERHPLDSTKNEIKEIISKVHHAVVQHEDTIEPVTEQFKLFNVLPLYPWLQPCCSFPFCSCIDEDCEDWDRIDF